MTKLKNIFDALNAAQGIADALAVYYNMAEHAKPILSSRTGVEREKMEADFGYLAKAIADKAWEARFGNTADAGNPLQWSSKNSVEYVDAAKMKALREASDCGSDIETDNNVAYWTAEYDREEARDNLNRLLLQFATSLFETVRGETYEYVPYEKKQRVNENIQRAVESMQINRQAKLITAEEMLKQAKSA